MKKLLYWLRKLGLLRTASYKVKGDAAKLNEVTASQGGMFQTQKEIDEKYGSQKKESEAKESKEERDELNG